MTSNDLPKTAVAEILAQKICALDAARLPAAVRKKCEELLIDTVGLAVTARNEDYVKSTLAACDDDGPCTVIGHARRHSAAAAALVNGTAIHGEDFDDTFEGGPVHTGAVVVPAGARRPANGKIATAAPCFLASPSASRPCAG